MLLNNLSETFNAYILHSRDKLIVQMLEMICKAVMSRIIKKREMVLKYNHPIYPNIIKKLEKNKKVSRYCLATWASDSIYKVEHSSNQYITDLEKYECSYFG